MKDAAPIVEMGEILASEMGEILASEMGDIPDIVSNSHTPMMILRVPSLVIIAASPGAHELLDPLVQPLIGHSLREFTKSHPSGAIPLLESGRITAYETLQVIKATGQRRRLWISALPDTQSNGLVVAMLLKDESAARTPIPWKDSDGSAPVIGFTDAGLMIDRVSSEVVGPAAQGVAEGHGAASLGKVLAGLGRSRVRCDVPWDVVGARIYERGAPELLADPSRIR